MINLKGKDCNVFVTLICYNWLKLYRRQEQKTNMKVLVIGNPLTVLRLKRALAGSGIDVIQGAELPLSSDFIMQNKADLVVIDPRIPGLVTICDQIYCMALVPVVLLLKKTAADWRIFSNINVDGFLEEGDGNAVFLGRVKALGRRKITTKMA